ncbi:hypothetical protein QBC34DRAFT_292699, partial [Podospora aff. communis PSN243]
VSSLKPYKPSDSIYVLGLDLKARYIMHALAGSKAIPPVQFLIHNNFLYRMAKRKKHPLRITLKRSGKYITRGGLDAVYCGEKLGSKPHESRTEGPHIPNLIVTVPAGHVIDALTPIAHQLDHRSTICLIQDGLGVAERVAETLFPDELCRPTFVLGHLMSTLSHVPEHSRLIENGHLSVGLETRRKLLLSIPPLNRSEEGLPLFKPHPPDHRVVRRTHLLNLLETVPELQATKCKYRNFLRHYKLNMIALRAIADPIATLLDITYDKFAQHYYARKLIENCVSEACDVISRFPECRRDEKFSRFRLRVSLRAELFRVIRNQQSGDNKMRTLVSRGYMTDVDFTTGYLVERGRKLGASVDALETLMLSVKAKQMVALKRQEEAIPFEEYYQRDVSDMPQEKEGLEEGQTAEQEEPDFEGENPEWVEPKHKVEGASPGAGGEKSVTEGSEVVADNLHV